MLQKCSTDVIPAKAGIQIFLLWCLDSRLHGNDKISSSMMLKENSQVYANKNLLNI